MVSQLMLSDLWRKFHKHFKFEKNLPAAVEEYFKFSEKEKLFCCYCGKELLEETEYPHYFAVSLDHKQPLSIGGENSFQNIAVCCCRCNICKGTMKEETYKKFLAAIKIAGIEEPVLNEMFWGRRANKVYRLQKDKDDKPKRVGDYA